jgi:hypothetical protein
MKKKADYLLDYSYCIKRWRLINDYNIFIGIEKLKHPKERKGIWCKISFFLE